MEEEEEEEEEEQDEVEREEEHQLDNIYTVVRQQNAVDIRTLLHVTHPFDPEDPDKHYTTLRVLFQEATAEVVKAVVLRDGVWATVDMCHFLLGCAIHNPDPGVLAFLLSYRGYRIPKIELQMGIYEAVFDENPNSLRQLLRDTRFDPTFDDNSALRRAHYNLQLVEGYERIFGAEKLRHLKEIYHLLLRDHRVLDSLAPSPSEFISRHHQSALLLTDIEAALADLRTRRMSVPAVTRGLPRVAPGMTAYDLQHIMGFAGITAESVGRCKCESCGGDKLPKA
jgi:hypothetical protein